MAALQGRTGQVLDKRAESQFNPLQRLLASVVGGPLKEMGVPTILDLVGANESSALAAMIRRTAAPGEELGPTQGHGISPAELTALPGITAMRIRGVIKDPARGRIASIDVGDSDRLFSKILKDFNKQGGGDILELDDFIRTVPKAVKVRDKTFISSLAGEHHDDILLNLGEDTIKSLGGAGRVLDESKKGFMLGDEFIDAQLFNDVFDAIADTRLGLGPL